MISSSFRARLTHKFQQSKQRQRMSFFGVSALKAFRVIYFALILVQQVIAPCYFRSQSTWFSTEFYLNETVSPDQYSPVSSLIQGPLSRSKPGRSGQYPNIPVYTSVLYNIFSWWILTSTVHNKCVVLAFSLFCSSNNQARSAEDCLYASSGAKSLTSQNSLATKSCHLWS